MKKTLVRIVAVLMLAAMILSVVPAFASGIVGTLANATDMYQKPNTSSKVVATVKGTVEVLFQNYEGTMYQVSLNYNGQTYTGWVPASAVTNIGRGSSTGSTSGSTGSSGSSSQPAGTYTGRIDKDTNVFSDTNQLIGIVKGTVTVNYRNSNSSQVNITASGTGGSVTGWVPASSFSKIYHKRTGSVKVSDLPSGGNSGSVMGGGAYDTFSTPLTAYSTDSTIYMRPTATKSTSGATKIRDAKGKAFTLIGQSGDFYYASYGNSYGFVRKQDFTSSSGGAATGTTGGTVSGVGSNGVAKPSKTYSKAEVGVSNDSTIIMRYKADKSTSKDNVVVKIKNAKGKQFSLLGETGSWYYARYTQNGKPYDGYVRKQDFTIGSSAATGGTISGSTVSKSTSGATSPGSGSSSEKWGSITVPGEGTYTIYGNYYRTVGGSNYYYYAVDKNGKENYDAIHTTTAAGSQIHAVMGHNMRKRSSNKMLHNLHHIQNALTNGAKCEASECRESTGSYKTTTFSASLDGYNSWDIALFYETPQKGDTSILPFNSQPWKSSTADYLNKQTSLVSRYGGWTNPSVKLDTNGKYMMLITCGDKYESGSNATSKLYMLLKAR